MRKLLEFLCYSNLYLAFGAAITTLCTLFMAGYPLLWDLVFIPFSASFLIYNLNRFTDIHEDSINLPNRTSFVRKFGRKILYVALVLYVFALFLAYQRGLLAFIFTLIPPVGGFFYSYFRLKTLFVIKNIMVAALWGFNVLIVCAFFGDFGFFMVLSYLFFFSAFLINVVIFDIKDIKGDSINKIDTLPVKIGIKSTKSFCLSILAALLAILTVMLTINIRSIVLLPFLFFIGFFIKYAQGSENSPWWYYGIFVDGEFFVILASIFLWFVLGVGF
ncbi:MAG: UbiA family prenyltransferase [Candidatus Aenigmatarchaeota archaeon]